MSYGIEIFLLVVALGVLPTFINYRAYKRGAAKGYKTAYDRGYKLGEHKGLLAAVEEAKKTDKWTEHLYVTGNHSTLKNLHIIVVPEPAAGIIVRKASKNIALIDNAIVIKEAVPVPVTYREVAKHES